MRNNYVRWVVVAAIVILLAIGGYFFFTPISVPNAALPVNGTVVAPPKAFERVRAQSQLNKAIADSGIVANYDTKDVVIYYTPSDGKVPNGQTWGYVAAPTTENNLKSIFGRNVMVVLDSQNAYGNGPIAYEVSFSDNNQAILTNPKTKPLTLDAQFLPQPGPFNKTSAFFVKGSCYLCFYGDSSVGCLVCI